MAEQFHKVPMELATLSTKLHVYYCIGFHKQSNVSEYATTCTVTT